MAILAFQKPENVLMKEAKENAALFEFKPLEPGYGITIGNALRRILLSSLEGFAIKSIKIDGVDHEFATIPGVLEDVTNIILNLKQVRLKQIVPDADEETISINVSRCDAFKAGDLNAHLSNFKVLNPDLLICQLDKSASFNIQLSINKGRGYVLAEDNRSENDELNTIAIDSIYTPIRNVKYWTEDCRVEQKTDYDKLLIEVVTDGSIPPKDALREAAKILMYHFGLFADDKISIEDDSNDFNDEFDEETLHIRQLLKTKLADLDLSVRALNCLIAADIEFLGDLVSMNQSDLMKIRNFGKKSLGELEQIITSLDLSFGMDVSKYKLDKD